MRRRLPSLIPLRAFEAVGRTGSVRGAAEELCVSHSVISHHMHALQLQLGVKLVRTRGRGIELTPEGMAFQHEVMRSFDIIAQATTNLSRTRGSMRLSCSPGFANRLLLPRLPELQARLPELEIVLTPMLTRQAPGRGEADVEIAYLDERPRDANSVAELLVRPRVFPVASPAFVERSPEAREIAAFAGLELLHEDSTQYWEQWLEAAHAPGSGRLRGTRLGHAGLTLEAARLGHGLALANDVLVTRELAAGDLVEPVVTDIRLGAYYFITASPRRRERAIVVLREWLHQALGVAAPGAAEPAESGPAADCGIDSGLPA